MSDGKIIKERTSASLEFESNTIFWIIFVVASLTVGAAQCWAHRSSMGPDGIGYLDVANKYIREGFLSLPNLHWSPLYPYGIAILMQLFQHNRTNDFEICHAMNYLSFVLSMGFFSFFLSQAYQYHRSRSLELAAPRSVFYILGSLLFADSALNLIDLSLVTPDLLLSGFVYAIAGSLLLQMNASIRTWSQSVLLATAMAAAYYTKVVMFPACLFLLVLKRFCLREKFKFLAGETVLFVALSAPLILGYSLAAKQPSFGQTGVTSYIFEVCLYQNKDRSRPAVYLLHPELKCMHRPTILSERPLTLYYAYEPAVTYAPHYDEAYWAAGIRPWLDVRNQMTVLANSLRYFYRQLIPHESLIAAAIASVMICAWSPENFRLTIARNLFFWLTLFVSGMYSLVWIENRYMAAFTVIFLLSIIMSMRLYNGSTSQRSIKAILLAGCTFFLFTNILPTISPMFFRENTEMSPPEIAKTACADGIAPGSSIAFVGNAIDQNWCYLNSNRVVAEIYGLWSAPRAMRDQAYAELSSHGVNTVISPSLPDQSEFGSWTKLGTTGLYYRQLLPTH